MDSQTFGLIILGIIVFFGFVYIVGSWLIDLFFQRKAKFVDDLHSRISDMKGKEQDAPSE